MRPSMKLAVIGAEVTVLAAFTGLGIHLAMQPHRVAFRPPPLVLPSVHLPALPPVSAPLVPPTPAKGAAATPSPFAPALFARFGQQDRNLVIQQWDIMQQLTAAIQRYVEARLTEQLKQKR
jgi:hypothetical protein